MSVSEDTAQRPGDAEVQRTVSEIRTMVREIQAAQRSLRTRSILATIVLLLMVIGFGSAIYAQLKAEFAAEKLQAAASSRMQLLIPELREPINQTLSRVVPHYVELGRQRFSAVGPKLDERTRAEADLLGRALEKKLNAQLDAFFFRLKTHANLELQKSFPALSGPEGDKVINKVAQVLVDENQKLHARSETLYQAESKRIGDALGKFPVPDVKSTDLDTLNRRLLHNLLMYADYEMVVKDAPAAAVPPSR